MTKGEWKYYINNLHNANNNGWKLTTWWHSYKNVTMVVCSFNMLVALYILQSQSTSLFLYTFSESKPGAKYTADQIRNMEESIKIRKALEPTHLIRFIKPKKFEVLGADEPIGFPERMKNMVTNELLMRLRSLEANAQLTVQQEAVESWRVEKLREAQGVISRKLSNASISYEEAGLLVDALGPDWSKVLERIGFWVPTEVDNTGYVDLPQSTMELEKQFIPRLELPPECKTELHTDYDGAAVAWGPTHHKESAYDCCMACIDHARNAKPNQQKCTVWVYCPSLNGCYSPDIYEHQFGECWLKYSKKPKLNFKDKYPESYRNSYPNAPSEVPWMSGFIAS